MIAISFKFLAGRYHATPWGRHVNEGAVEWPPSPWRILRALIATWKRTLPDVSEADVKPILKVLAAESPEFLLPPATAGHTRHYMPWYKKGPDDRTLVFDTFIAVLRDAPLVARWPHVSLNEGHRAGLSRILANLNTLGRAESWCEARLLPEGEAAAPDGHATAQPLDGLSPGTDREIVRVLCPDSESAFVDDHVVAVRTKTSGRGKNKQTVVKRTTIYDPAWNLCIETLQLHKERWSDPPGSRWVQYSRPRDCFKIEYAQTGSFSRRGLNTAQIQVVRYALDSVVLPLVTETLPVAEAARRALMSIYGRLTEYREVRGRSPILSGKNQHGDPLNGHGHAYYLPTDEDGDGRMDHLTVFARDGFGPEERRALDRLHRIKPYGRDNASHPLRVLLLGMGMVDEYHPGPIGKSKVWVSATPYIATRYAKTRGRNQIDLRSRLACDEFLVADLRAQLRAVLCQGGENADDIEINPMRHGGTLEVAGRWRPIQFKRFRSKPGDDGGRRLAGAFNIRFPSEIPGPVSLGYGAHFGLGLFIPHCNRPATQGD